MCLAKPSFPSLPAPPPPAPPPPNPLVQQVGPSQVQAASQKRSGLGISQLLIPYKGIQP
jgi:hypothetical protein